MKAPVKRGRVMAEINITPFTDVVLVLLIIFMITTPLMVQPGIKVNLPKAQAAESTADKTILVAVDAAGAVYINNRRVAVEALQQELTAYLVSAPDRPVVVRADRSVKYDTVVRVIDAAKQSGAKSFALSVEKQ